MLKLGFAPRHKHALMQKPNTSFYFCVGDLDEGIASYLKALSVCENYAPAHYNLGVVYNEMGLVRL